MLFELFSGRLLRFRDKELGVNVQIKMDSLDLGVEPVGEQASLIEDEELQMLEDQGPKYQWFDDEDDDDSLDEDEFEEEFEPWASQYYGAMVKSARKKAGYSTAQAFSETVYRRTRVRITRDVLYKIEQGRQNPDVVQFMAINLSLFNAPFPKKIAPCISQEWASIAANEGGIPLEWRRQNTRDLEEATGRHFVDGEAAAKAAKDDPALFSYGSGTSTD